MADCLGGAPFLSKNAAKASIRSMSIRHIGGAVQLRFERFDDGSQHLVSGGMPTTVVVVFEKIHVQHNQRKRGVLMLLRCGTNSPEAGLSFVEAILTQFGIF